MVNTRVLKEMVLCKTHHFMLVNMLVNFTKNF